MLRNLLDHGQTNRQRRHGKRREQHSVRSLACESLEPRILLTAGLLDTDFGGDGDVTTQFQEAGQDRAIGAAIAEQADGKLVAAGYVSANGEKADFGLVRYNTDGTIDSSFGTAGYVVTAIGNSFQHDFAEAVAVQPDGKIIAAGRTRDTGPGYRSPVYSALIRYHPDGSLDSTFGDGKGKSKGRVVNELAGAIQQLALQPDGKIVAGSWNELARYNSDGSLDTSFGDDGVVTGVSAYDMQLMTDGRIVVTGPNSDFTAFQTARYLANGDLDTSFSDDGIVETVVGHSGNGVAVQADGKVISVGDKGMVRYNSDGTLDTSFATNGIFALNSLPVNCDFKSPALHDVVVDEAGRIVVAGYKFQEDQQLGGGSWADTLVMRFDANGDLDASFGVSETFDASCTWSDPFTIDGGVVTQSLYTGNDSRANELTIQDDGKIVTVGFNDPAGDGSREFRLIRLLGDPLPAGVTVTPIAGLQTTEAGGTATFDVVLDKQPTADVTIALSSSDATEGTVSPSSLTFTTTDWDTPQTVTITGQDDALVDGDIAYTIITANAASTDPDYDGLAVDDVSVTNEDDEAPPSTKFFVADDGSNEAFEYSETGSALAGETWSLDGGNTDPRGATANEAGTTVWIVDSNKKVNVYDEDGVFQGSWAAKGGLKTPVGVATDETDIWIADTNGDKVLRYAGAASRTSGNQGASGSFGLDAANPTGITTDGTTIWVVDSGTDRVYSYLAADGSSQGDWPLDSANGSPTGLTIDPSGASNSVWVVDNNTDTVYEYDRDTGDLVGNFALSGSNGNPQGIADPPPVLLDELTTTVHENHQLVWAAWDERVSRPLETVTKVESVHIDQLVIGPGSVERPAIVMSSDEPTNLFITIDEAIEQLQDEDLLNDRLANELVSS